MLLALGATSSQAWDFKGDARVWLGLGVDSNPSRDFTSPGTATPYDAFGAAIVALSGVIGGERAQLYGAYEFGGRKFLSFASQDTEVQSATLDGTLFLSQSLSAGATVRARDRRGAEREYTDLAAEAYLEFTPDPSVSVRAHGGFHRFLYWNAFGSSYAAPSFGATAKYKFNKRHQVFLHGDAEPQKHNADACQLDPVDKMTCVVEEPPRARQDTFFSVGLGYTYRGPFLLTVQYSYLDLSSNSYGETFRRHRFAGNAGFRLPLDFTLLASAAVQIAQYPDGVCLSSCTISLQEDDENATMGSLKLVHPLGAHFDLDLRYAVYFNRLPTNNLSYLRMVGSLGASWRW